MTFLSNKKIRLLKYLIEKELKHYAAIKWRDTAELEEIKQDLEDILNAT